MPWSLSPHASLARHRLLDFNHTHRPMWLCGPLLARELYSWLSHYGLVAWPMPTFRLELNNGISEVCAIEWIALWATLRVLKTNRWRDWISSIGQGLSSTATFYYGQARALILSSHLCFLSCVIIHRHSIFRYLADVFWRSLFPPWYFFPWICLDLHSSRGSAHHPRCTTP